MTVVDNFSNKIFGTWSDREIKKIFPLVQAINNKEKDIRKLSDHQLQQKSGEFKEKLEKGASLDDILPEAFAVCREAGARVLGMRHFDVQLIGGIALHRGWNAEMKTGEGKTLVASLACYLNGLSGKGAHVITVNDYLARRDAEWMGQIHRFLGLEVGCILNSMYDGARKKQYNADITYGTNNEFGFDYLRDNMKPDLDLYVQRDLNFAIVDEVDSILIDEARTPLIISGPVEESVNYYDEADRVVRRLRKDLDYTVEEKHRNVTLTEDGIVKLEKLLNITNLYAPNHLELVHHVHAALKAHAIFKRDKDYVVRDGQVIIVDEYTGRLMPGRRWSDGLHQAVEAKEGAQIEGENQTLATITLQNYFRMYNKLSGMTGTAATEAKEFKKVYGLEVLEIPTNRPLLRDDTQDLVYRNEAGKYRAVIDDIKEKHEKGRPVLVGTTSVSKSERVAKLLNRQGISHVVLNAKNHGREADIVAEAGEKGSVTIATNMAGRGTDIILGEGVKEAGGLHVIGTERHESRRIDNQLRGRAGRQGDPGSSQFYLSLEDDLMRIFASDKVIAIMDRLGMEENVPISDKLVTRSIASAQKKVEGHHFEQREHLLKYDDVLNKQREVIYSMRRLVLDGKEIRKLLKDLCTEFTTDIVQQFCPPKTPWDEWPWEDIDEAVKEAFNLEIANEKHLELKANPKQRFDAPDFQKWLYDQCWNFYEVKVERTGEELMNQVEKHYLIQSIDNHWKDHLHALDKLREGIHLRGYAQKDPLLEYRKEGFAMFKLLDKAIKQSALTRLFQVQIRSKEEQEAEQRRMQERQQEVENKISELKLQEKENPADQAGELAAPAEGLPNPQDLKTDEGVAAALQFMQKYREDKMREIEQSQSQHAGSDDASPNAAAAQAPVERQQPKVGRNDPCPCGSGKKYKQCHG